MNETIPYLPGLSPVAGKELCARFDGGRLSSDGGVLLFAGIERRLGIAELLASRVTDEREPASTTHSYADMIRARMFAIACGYEDCDDLDALRFDPAFKLACGRLPEAVEHWSLTTLQNKLIKIGAKVVRHGRYVTFQLAEVAIPRDLFAEILQRIGGLRPGPVPP